MKNLNKFGLTRMSKFASLFENVAADLTEDFEFCVFIALKTCCEYIRGLRYKLRMMGIPMNGHTYIYGDNKLVLSNASIPESVLKKKSVSIAYNYICEGSAADKWRIAYVETTNNLADLLTKPLSGEKRRHLVRQLLHHI